MLGIDSVLGDGKYSSLLAFLVIVYPNLLVYLVLDCVPILDSLLVLTSVLSLDIVPELDSVTCGDVFR